MAQPALNAAAAIGVELEKVRTPSTLFENWG